MAPKVLKAASTAAGQLNTEALGPARPEKLPIGINSRRLTKKMNLKLKDANKLYSAGKFKVNILPFSPFLLRCLP